MCFRLNCKEKRPRRKWFLILLLSSERGCLVQGKGQAGAQRELQRVGGPIGRTPGRGREADGERLVSRRVSSEGK